RPRAVAERAMKVMVTGGAGFIGSAVCRLFVGELGIAVLNLDKLTYAANPASLQPIAAEPGYSFRQGDICDRALVAALLRSFQPDAILHLAAESHVDRSIDGPGAFIRTNIEGTYALLEAALDYWRQLPGEDRARFRFHHVSTDEVFGSLGATGRFTEQSPYRPNSPYSASKAASDHLVRAWYHTYGLPVVMSNCSNNYGSYHFPEKLIPLMINNIKNNKPLPVYGKGENVRDWLFVEDHARAIDVIFHKGKTGDKYNIGGFNEWKNIDLVHLLCKIMDKKLGRAEGTSAQLITYVKDRPGHDMRYAIDASKLNKELGWKPSLQFEEGLEKTVDWYLQNEEWITHVTSGDYQHYYEEQYTK